VQAEITSFQQKRQHITSSTFNLFNSPLYLVSPMVEQQTISQSALITAISWTGGKDCNLALLRAWRNGDFDVRYLLVFRLSTKPFQAHPIQFMEAQARSLGLELIFVNFPEVTDWMCAYSYVEEIIRVRDKYGIRVISTGDINLVGTMQRNWIERACEKAEIQSYLPLWDINKENALNVMLNEGLEVIFSCVKSPFFDESWISRKLDQEAIQA
jgi:diphthamide synthase (EF-2-diphthine--ammonia ligase)